MAPATINVPRIIQDCARDILQLLASKGGSMPARDLDRARVGLGYVEQTWRAGKLHALVRYRPLSTTPGGKTIWEAYL